MIKFSSPRLSRTGGVPSSNQDSVCRCFSRSLPSNLYCRSLFGTNLPPKMRIKANGAARPNDYEAKIYEPFENSTKFKIAIIGFSNYGQFLAKFLVRQGHSVLAYSRSNYSIVARELGVVYFSDPDDLCEEHPDVILICTSIISTESVLRSLPLHRLKRNTLFVDVLSVKEFPRNLFLQILPQEFDILCTHPMFGPESDQIGRRDLPFVYDKVRIGSEESRLSRCERFLKIFAQEGFRMVEMSCAEHDKFASGSQLVTHTVGRVLEKLGLESTPINTKGYETLLNLAENAAKESFELDHGLIVYNKNALEQLQRLDMAFKSIKMQLFRHLHVALRKQMFENGEEVEEVSVPEPMLSKLLENAGFAAKPSSETTK